MSVNVAIDGPAGAGKSTIAKRVAKEKNYIYVDTGAMYRALAYHVLQMGVNPEDENLVSEACKQASVSLRYQGGAQLVILNDVDVSGKIREEKVGNTASIVSRYPDVRAKLLSLQRDLAAREDVIMDGRDIGTCVLPNADAKIYLTASSAVRAERRYLELTEKGVTCNLQQIEEDIIKRDEQDMNRSISPLKQATDAVLVDSSHMNLDEVVARIIQIIDHHQNKE